MVKNLIGGCKAKGMSNKKQNSEKNKKFVKPNSEFEIIGKVIKENGSARFDVEIYINKNIKRINCSAPKRIRIKTDNFVLVSLLRENKISKILLGEIVHQYDPIFIDDLKQYDEPLAKKENRKNIISILNKGTDDSLFSLNTEKSDILIINEDKTDDINDNNDDIDNI